MVPILVQQGPESFQAPHPPSPGLPAGPSALLLSHRRQPAASLRGFTLTAPHTRPWPAAVLGQRSPTPGAGTVPLNLPGSGCEVTGAGSGALGALPWVPVSLGSRAPGHSPCWPHRSPRPPLVPQACSCLGPALPLLPSLLLPFLQPLAQMGLLNGASSVWFKIVLK